MLNNMIYLFIILLFLFIGIGIYLTIKYPEEEIVGDYKVGDSVYGKGYYYTEYQSRPSKIGLTTTLVKENYGTICYGTISNIKGNNIWLSGTTHTVYDSGSFLYGIRGNSLNDLGQFFIILGVMIICLLPVYLILNYTGFFDLIFNVK